METTGTVVGESEDLEKNAFCVAYLTPRCTSTPHPGVPMATGPSTFHMDLNSSNMNTENTLTSLPMSAPECPGSVVVVLTTNVATPIVASLVGNLGSHALMCTSHVTVEMG